jgi:hypothetical protein
VVLDCRDNGSGVLSAEYAIDNPTFQPYGEPFTVSGSGPRTLRYRSADRLGNKEPEQAWGLFVDGQPPVTTATTAVDREAGTATVSFSATDSGSGLAAVKFRALRDGTALGDWTSGERYRLDIPDDQSADGNYTVEYYSVDNTNNIEAVNKLVVNIDTDVYLRMGFPGTITVDNPRYLVEGRTEAGSVLTINKQPVIVTPDGTFATQVGLQPGSNKVLVSMVDPAGNLYTKTYYITYNAPVQVASWVIPLLVLLVAAILVGAASYLIIKPAAPIPRAQTYQ